MTAVAERPADTTAIPRRTVTVKIRRFNPETDTEPHWQSFQVEALPTDRVLNLLINIKGYQDGTLTFRRSCAHGVCGSDAMRINGVNRLACKVLVKDMPDEIMIEPINPRDMPGYFLQTQLDAHAIREEIAMPNLKVQMDLYHAQVVEGDLSHKLRHWLPHIGHIQIAGVPDRHEPDTGEVNYAHIFRLLDELKYPGYVGCEYRPARGTLEGLTWFYKLIDRPPARA